MNTELFTLREVWTVVRTNWILVAALAVVGAVAGAGLAQRSAYTQVEVTLSNIRIPGTATRVDKDDITRAVKAAAELDALSANAEEVPALEVTEFVQLQKELAPLAASRGGLGVLASPAWWMANLEPVMALSPADEDVFGDRPVEMETDTYRIVSLLVRAAGAEAADAGALADRAVEFLRRAGASRELARLLDTYRAEAETLGQHYALAALRQLDVEVAYLRQREALLLAMPGGDSGSMQAILTVTEPDQLRYLPRQAQLTAVRVEVLDKTLEQKRLRALMQRGRILGEFVTQAPAAQASVPNDDGLALVKEWRKRALALRDVESDGLHEEALVQQAVVESILARLNMLEARFTTMLPESARRVERLQRVPTTRAGLVGFVSGLLVAFAIGLLRRAV